MKHMRHLRKWTAVSLSVILSFAEPGQSLFAQNLPNAPTTSSFTLTAVDQLQLPETIGEIRDRYQGNTGRAVILIQDAHAVPEAQRQIRNAIDFFQQTYGLKTIALEGATQALDPRIFRSFPDRQLLKQVFQGYLERGELTGTSMAAVFNQLPAVYVGIEDEPLYEQAFAAFLDSLDAMPARREEYRQIEEELQSLKQTVYSPQLLQIDQSLTQFYHNEKPLAELLQLLAAVKAPESGSSLALMIGEMDQDTASRIPVEVEVRKLAEAVEANLKDHAPDMENGREVVASFNEKLQSFQLSQVSPEEFALILKELTVRLGMKIRVSQTLQRMIEQHKRLRDLEGTRFYDELQAYIQDVKQSLFENDRQRLLDRQSHELLLLYKLMRLELTADEWEEIKKIQPGTQELMLRDFRRRLGVQNIFYESTEARDRFFAGRIQELLQDEPLVAMVAGGFHTSGLRRLLEDSGISYVTATPAIRKLPDENTYHEQMRGRVSWSGYYEEDAAGVNAYRAFVRFTRDQLLALSPVEQGLLLKEWRDAVIRDLASENRTAEAGRYTAFIDELSSASIVNTEALQVYRFADALRSLEQTNALHKENILQLFSAATLSIRHTYMILEDAFFNPRPELREAGVVDGDERSEQRIAWTEPEDAGEFNAVVRNVQDYLWVVQEWRGFVETLDSVIVTNMERAMTFQLQGEEKIRGNPMDWLRQGAIHVFGQQGRDLDSIMPLRLSLIKRQEGDHDEYVLTVHLQYRSEQRQLKTVSLDPLPEDDSLAAKNRALFNEITSVGPGLLKAIDAIEINELTVNENSWYLGALFKKEGKGIATKRFLEVLVPENIEEVEAEAGFRLYAERRADGVHATVFEGDTIPGQTPELIRALFSYVENHGVNFVHLHHLSDYSRALFTRELEKYGPRPDITGENFQVSLAQYDFASDPVRSEMRLQRPEEQTGGKLALLDPAPGAANEQKAAGFYNEIVSHSKALSERIGSVQVESFVMHSQTLSIGLRFLDFQGNQIVTRILRDDLDYEAPMEINIIAQQEPGGSLYIANFDSTGLKGFSDQVLRVTLDWFSRSGVDRVAFDLLTPHSRRFLNWFLPQFGKHVPIQDEDIFVDIELADFDFSQSPDTPDALRSEQRDHDSSASLEAQQLLLAGSGYEVTPVRSAEKGYFTIEDEFDEPESFITFIDAFRVMRAADTFFSRLAGFGERARALTVNLRNAAHELATNIIDHGNGQGLVAMRRVSGEAPVFEILGRDFGEGIADPQELLTKAYASNRGKGLQLFARLMNWYPGSTVTLESNGRKWVLQNAETFSAAGESAVVEGTQITIQVPESAGRRSEQRAPQIPPEFYAYGQPFTIGKMKGGIKGIRPDIRIIEDAEVGIGTMFAIPNLTFRVVPMGMADYEARLQAERIQDPEGLAMKEVLPYRLEVYEFDPAAMQHRFRPIPEILFSRGEAFTIGRLQGFDSSNLTHKADLEADLGIRPLDTEESPQAYPVKGDRVAIYQGDPAATGVFLPRRNNEEKISRYRTEPDKATRYEDHRDISPDYVDESAYERPGHVDIEIVESDAGDVVRLTSRGSRNGVRIQKTNTLFGSIPEYGNQVGVPLEDLSEQSESMNSLVLPRGAEVEVVREAPSIHHPKYPFEVRVEDLTGKVRIRIALQYIEDDKGTPQFRIYDEASESVSDQIFDLNQTELQGWLLPFEIKLSKLLGRPRAVIRLRDDSVLNQIRDGYNGKPGYIPRVFVRTLSDKDVADEMSEQVIQRAREQNLLPAISPESFLSGDSSDQTIFIGGITGKFVLENGRVDFRELDGAGRLIVLKLPHSSKPAAVSAGEPLGIGRHPANQIVLSKEGVSRHHAKVTFENGRYFIEDLDSTNGMTVDGIRISKPTEITFRSEQRTGEMPEVLRAQLDAVEQTYRRRLQELKDTAGEYLNPELQPDGAFEARYSEIVTDVITDVFEAYSDLYDLQSKVSAYVLGSLARRAAPYGTDIDIFVVAAEDDEPVTGLIERIVADIDRILGVGVDMPVAPSIHESEGVFVVSAAELRNRFDELVGVSLRSLLDRRRIFGSDNIHLQLEQALDSNDFYQALSRWHDLNVGRMTLEDASLLSREDLEELLDRYLNRRIDTDLKIEKIQAALKRKHDFEFDELILEGLLNEAYTLDDIYESSNFLGNQLFEQTDQFTSLEKLQKFDPKRDPGGLRTIQIIGYLGRYLYADDAEVAAWTYTKNTMYDLPRFLAEMTDEEFLTDEDVQSLEEATAFFLRFRTALNLAVERSGNRELKKDEYDAALRDSIAKLMKLNSADLDGLIIQNRKAMVRLFSELLDLHFDYAERSEQRRFTLDLAPGASQAEREAALFRDLQEISPALAGSVFDAVLIERAELAGRPERFLRVVFRKDGAPIPTRVYTGRQSFESEAGFNLEAEVVPDDRGGEKVRMIGFYGGNIPGHTSEMIRMLFAFVSRRGADSVVLNHLNPYVRGLFTRELSKYGPAPVIPDGADTFELELAQYDFSKADEARSEQRLLSEIQAEAVTTVLGAARGFKVSPAARQSAATVILQTGGGAFADLLESVYGAQVGRSVYESERRRLLDAFRARFKDSDLSLGLLFPSQETVWRGEDLSVRLAEQVLEIGAGEVVLSGENIVAQPFRDRNLRVRQTSASRKIYVPGQEELLPMAVLGQLSDFGNLHPMYLPVWAEGLESIRDPELRDHIQFLQLLSAATVGALTKQNPALAADRTLLGAELIRALGPAYERIVVMQNGGLGINSAAAQVFMKILAADRIAASA